MIKVEINKKSHIFIAMLAKIIDEVIKKTIKIIVIAKKIPAFLSFFIFFLKNGSSFFIKNPTPLTGWGNHLGSPNIKSAIKPKIMVI